MYNNKSTIHLHYLIHNIIDVPYMYMCMLNHKVLTRVIQRGDIELAQ